MILTYRTETKEYVRLHLDATDRVACRRRRKVAYAWTRSGWNSGNDATRDCRRMRRRSYRQDARTVRARSARRVHHVNVRRNPVTRSLQGYHASSPVELKSLKPYPIHQSYETTH